jgi:hypothetical protein
VAVSVALDDDSQGSAINELANMLAVLARLEGMATMFAVVFDGVWDM